MATPLISIVLPVYNGWRFLEESIRSCLNQTYTYWELIIVDDASTDNTPEIISRYAAQDRRIAAVRHNANRKLPGALNTGFARAQGEYLTWTSDDNRYRPQALAELAGFLRANPNVDLVYADFTRMNEAGEAVRRVRVPEPEALAYSNCVGACFLYRRRIQERLGGYAEDLFGAEDYDFWLRAGAEFRLQALHQDLYLYRMHETSLSATKRKRNRGASETSRARNLPKLTWVSPDARAEGYLRLAYLASLRKDFRTAWGYAALALRSSSGWVLRRFLKIPLTLMNIKRHSRVVRSMNLDFTKVFLTREN
jgi:glycosyltransferase involved in cell wall biosynthesis